MAKSRVANPFEDTTRMSPAPGPQAGEGNAAYLVVLAGSNVGEMYKVDKDRTVMGRGDSVDIRLFDEGISREHAQVVQEKSESGTQNILEDMGSTNGTFCNGARVQRQVLGDGDKILLGSTTILKFSYQDKLDEMFQRQMSESALRDGLTKAFNKRYFTERLESEYLYAVRHDAPMSLLFLDIDHFKRINDVHGHPAGDYVLVELAKLAHGCLRNEDIFCRYGGEEFAVISRGTDVADAQALAERLRQTVEGHAFAFEGKPISVTISVGVARAPRLGVGSPAELVAAADETMYTAKRSGRNRVCIAPDGEPITKAPGSGPVKAS
jgi:two-component system cell cycle response regulator